MANIHLLVKGLSYRVWPVLLLGLLVGLPSYGQHLEAVGVEASMNVTQTLATPETIFLTPDYAIATNGDGSKYDDVGHRLAAFARFRVKQSRFFVQPEIGYTSTEGQRYLVLYGLASKYGPSWFPFFHHIKRWEVAGLGGLHTGRHTYVLLGPVLAFNKHEGLLPVDPTDYPAGSKIVNSLTQSAITAQILAQLGVGVTFGRFDFNLRLEQSLTPYTRRFTFNNGIYGYRQQIRQGLFTAGILLYKAKPKPVASRE